MRDRAGERTLSRARCRFDACRPQERALNRVPVPNSVNKRTRLRYREFSSQTSALSSRQRCTWAHERFGAGLFAPESVKRFYSDSIGRDPYNRTDPNGQFQRSISFVAKFCGITSLRGFQLVGCPVRVAGDTDESSVFGAIRVDASRLVVQTETEKIV